MKLTGINQLWVADITLHPAESRVCIFSGDPRWVLSERGGLGTRSNLSNSTDDAGTGASHRDSTTRTWLGASLRSRIAIRFRRIRESPREQPRDSEHEPASKSI